MSNNSGKYIGQFGLVSGMEMQFRLLDRERARRRLAPELKSRARRRSISGPPHQTKDRQNL